MFIRQIREHLSARERLAVSLDLGIAILGMFIGIQVSNWNQDGRDHQKGCVYRHARDLLGQVAAMGGR